MIRSHTRPFPRPPMAPPPPLARVRGVHSYRDAFTGETIHYGITSRITLLNGEFRRQQEEETEAMLRTDMWRDLDKQDSVLTARPRLSVYAAVQPPAPRDLSRLG